MTGMLAELEIEDTTVSKIRFGLLILVCPCRLLGLLGLLGLVDGAATETGWVASDDGDTGLLGLLGLL